MLVLTRRVGESIIIDNNIIVKVCALRDGQVKIGVHAPKNVTINREEVQNRNDPRRD